LLYFVVICCILWSFVVFCGYLLYFVDICYILRTFGIFCFHLVYFMAFRYLYVNLVYFPRFGMLYQLKSGTTYTYNIK
jgi:hypothetical protein